MGAARPTASRPQIFRQIARRGYASGGHESAKAGGDAIWAAGAVAVTAPTGDKNSQSAKQEGLSNTDTKHSTDIGNDPSKSKKAEGGPDTAKVKGTVDPNRPQV